MFHRLQAYLGLRRNATVSAAAAAYDADATLDTLFTVARRHNPALWQGTAVHEPTRQARFEELCGWLLLYLPPLPAHRRTLIEALIQRLDIGLREAGVGDMSVGKEIRAYAAALHGRLQRYEPLALRADLAPLQLALISHDVAESTTYAIIGALQTRQEEAEDTAQTEPDDENS